MRTCIIVDCDGVLYRCNLESVSKLNQEIQSSYSIADITHWGMMKNPLDQRSMEVREKSLKMNFPQIKDIYLGDTKIAISKGCIITRNSYRL